MHVRFTTVIGMPVTDDQSDEDIGIITNVLIQPDTAKIEGFFVMIPAFLSAQTLFLPAVDIVHFGSRIRIRHTDALAPLSDMVRLQSLLEDGRRVLGQRMETESGVVLGTCRDVQFETLSFQIEWLFPRRWFQWKRGVPRSGILEVRQESILVRDPGAKVKKASVKAASFPTLDPLAGTAPLSRTSDQ